MQNFSVSGVASSADLCYTVVYASATAEKETRLISGFFVKYVFVYGCIYDSGIRAGLTSYYEGQNSGLGVAISRPRRQSMESIKWIICHLLAFAFSRLCFDLHAGFGQTTAYSYPSNRSPHTGQMCGTLRRSDWRAEPGLVMDYFADAAA
jgi:hypothetical protein